MRRARHMPAKLAPVPIMKKPGAFAPGFSNKTLF